VQISHFIHSILLSVSTQPSILFVLSTVTKHFACGGTYYFVLRPAHNMFRIVGQCSICSFPLLRCILLPPDPTFRTWFFSQRLISGFLRPPFLGPSSLDCIRSHEDSSTVLEQRFKYTRPTYFIPWAIALCSNLRPGAVENVHSLINFDH
jgi:hypothetical protein